MLLPVIKKPETNKEKIIRDVAKAAKLTGERAEEALDAMLATIKSELGKGNPVIIRRFGRFHVRKKNARIGRNPMTGEPAPITARTVPVFNAGKFLKAAIRKGGRNAS